MSPSAFCLEPFFGHRATSNLAARALRCKGVDERWDAVFKPAAMRIPCNAFENFLVVAGRFASQL